MSTTRDPGDGDIVYRRFRRTRDGRVLDARHYGIKAWPIRIRKPKAQQATPAAGRHVWRPAADCEGYWVKLSCRMPMRQSDLQVFEGAIQMGKNQWVVPRSDGWAVRGEGNTRDTSHHDTQAQAIEVARNLARKERSELFVQDQHGKIRERNTYGHDPFPPKG